MLTGMCCCTAGVLMRKLVRRLAMVQVNLATLACSETTGEQYGSAPWHSQCLREMHYLQALLAETQVCAVGILAHRLSVW